MSDASNSGKGVQAHRWLVTIGMSFLVALSARVMVTIDRTAEKVDALQLQVTGIAGVLDGRINVHVQRLETIDRRNDAQDLKIDDLQRRVWRLPETRSP